MKVILMGVNGNLNRCIRTCYTFGVGEILLYKCGEILKGNLFSAKDNITLRRIENMDNIDMKTVLALEKGNHTPLKDVCMSKFEYIVIGGESITLKKSQFPNIVTIATKNQLCLTAEAALSIALYERG